MFTKEGSWVRESLLKWQVFVELTGIIWLKGRNGCGREKSMEAKSLEREGG